jgi:hypothetical protein
VSKIKKVIVIIILLVTIEIFGGAYIQFSTNSADKQDIDFLEQKSIVIGVRDEFYVWDWLFWGYDASYISPKIVDIENRLYFDIGYASYDFYVGFDFDRFKIKLFHNCTHIFKSVDFEHYWEDLDRDYIEFEWVW